uniref:Lipase domain-containing protein n=1 Tax=Tetranychus urticae TaxID=32264 RepID=T1L329_TETUR
MSESVHSNRAKYLFYWQVVTNASVVGFSLADCIKTLNEIYGLNFADVQLIGHSSGSHVAWICGEPGPLFNEEHPTYRRNSENFGLGLVDSVGTVDYFPNGGLFKNGFIQGNFMQSLIG